LKEVAARNFAAKMEAPKKFKVSKKPSTYVYPAYNKNPITFEEQVTANVIEWYMNLGLPVPQEDLDACHGIDAQDKAAAAVEAAKPIVVKPAYGTPEFWKEWWAKKRAKEAAAAAAGIPLPENPKKKSPTKPSKPAKEK